MTREHRRAETD